jgi:hypothetical protein
MKIPKPVKRGDVYRIQIQIDGKRISCTRDTIKECEHWAATKFLESKIATKEVEQGIKPKFTFRELVIIIMSTLASLGSPKFKKLD